MLKAVNIEVLELPDAKGAIGTFKVVDTWNGFKKLQSIDTGNIMLIAPVQTATMANTFAGAS